MSRIPSKSKQPVGIAGRILGSLFFFFFFAIGSAFCVFVARDFHLNLQARNWPAVECHIMESRVSEERSRGEEPYHFVVRYDYEWQGNKYSTSKWSRQDRGFSDYSKAQSLVTAYPLDGKAKCFVNPANPQQAILEKPSLWIGAILPLPLVFVGVGLIGIFAMWTRSSSNADQDSKTMSNRPISARRNTKLGRGVGVVFFSFFFLIGLVVFYFLALQPMLGVAQARGWRATPCTIVSSQVLSQRGSDSTTYRVDILYSYEVNGREFRSNRYKFMGGSSSGRKGKAAIVRRFPAGSQATCYVSPDNPQDAVLERGFTSDMWLGLIPAVFMLVGAGGIIGMLRQGRLVASDASPYERVSMRQITSLNTAPVRITTLDLDPAAPRILKSSSSKFAAVIFIGLFAAVWNGVIFFGFILNSGLFRRGRADAFDWFGILFMIPFVAVGLFMIGLLVHQILALFNPKIQMTLTPGTPSLGGKISLTWQLTGRTHILRGLKIYLEAREEATYRRGTSTSTDRKPFLKLNLYSSASLAEMSSGLAKLSLPADSLPSFKSDNNKIIWAIHVAGDIPRWPDLKEEFVIEVAPASSPASVPQASRLPDEEVVSSSPGVAQGGALPPQRDDLKILLRDGRTAFRPGETIEGVAGWRLDKLPKSVELRLFWFTRGKGTGDVGMAGTLKFPEPQMEEGRKFSFTLPPEPWSFSGQLISLIWALELVVEPGELSTRVELVVSPNEREIQLQNHASA